ncbi:dermokine [Ornithorhynchus anatinus]|uniref:dermokine n=1 Tax=Ornithorhynchus anatinus TaxID=9258 RepID=UPI0010A83441|nr:dermokine [Ornithorhynchus anatinus]
MKAPRPLPLARARPPLLLLVVFLLALLLGAREAGSAALGGPEGPGSPGGELAGLDSAGLGVRELGSALDRSGYAAGTSPALGGPPRQRPPPGPRPRRESNGAFAYAVPGGGWHRGDSECVNSPAVETSAGGSRPAPASVHNPSLGPDAFYRETSTETSGGDRIRNPTLSSSSSATAAVPLAATAKPECENMNNENRVAATQGTEPPSSFSGRGPSGGSGTGLHGSEAAESGEARSEAEVYRGSSPVGLHAGSPGLFNFDTFWKNFKSKLNFINWDAISKRPNAPTSTRTMLYFSRLWEDFKHKTPFFNWKIISEDVDPLDLQKRSVTAVSGLQPAARIASTGQQPYPTPFEAGSGATSAATRAEPGLLRWVRVW